MKKTEASYKSYGFWESFLILLKRADRLNQQHPFSGCYLTHKNI